MKHLRALNKYFWKYKFRFLTGIIFIILSNYFNVLSPQLMRFIVNYVDAIIAGTADVFSFQNDKGYDILVKQIITYLLTFKTIGSVVIVASIVLLLLALLRGFFLFLMRQTIIVMSRFIEYDQKNEVFEKYLQLDTAFFKSNSTGDLMNRIAEDVSRVRIFTGPAIMYIVNLVSVITLSIFFMFRSSPELTFYVLIPLPVLAIIIYFVNNTIHKKSEKIQESLSNLTTNAQESYSGIRVIKSFVQERHMLRYFTANSETYRQNAVGLAKVEALYFPSITFLIGLSTLLTIMIGGLYYINHQHEMTLGTLVEFIVYVNMLTFPVSAIGLTASMVQRAAVSQKRLNEFLSIDTAIKNQPDAKPVNTISDIDLNKVNFTYPGTGIHAVKNFTLAIKKGEKIAITGKTGSGKTTMAQLLLRMYDVDNGDIKIDGTPLKELDIATLRRQISYVPQDVFLFSDTIENNIRFGAPEAGLEQIKAAAAIAHVAGEIENFADGYQTLVGERGVTLSGGQKQRISIARALVKDPSLLILDDCLSAVDAKVEKLITEQLNQYLENRTAIVITHRVFSLLHFDKIIVMNEGEIAEMDTHQNLMKIENGLYRQLYEAQQADAKDM